MASLDSERLRVARVKAGWSQARLAAAVSVATQLVGRWERGDTQPTSDEVRQLARALDVDASSLLRLPPGPTLAALREAKGLTQAEVADAVGVGLVAYRQMERGALTDDLLVRKIAVVLDHPAYMVLAAVEDAHNRLREAHNRL